MTIGADHQASTARGRKAAKQSYKEESSDLTEEEEPKPKKVDSIGAWLSTLLI
jgi:hypothetical protein